MENTNPMGTSLQSKLKKTSSIPLKPIDFASLGLFGNIGEEELPELIYAPNTQLALELLGVFKSGNSNQSIAVVAQRGNAGKLYRIGDRRLKCNFRFCTQPLYPNQSSSRLENLMFKEKILAGLVVIRRLRLVQKSSRAIPMKKIKSV